MHHEGTASAVAAATASMPQGRHWGGVRHRLGLPPAERCVCCASTETVGPVGCVAESYSPAIVIALWGSWSSATSPWA